MRSPVPSLPLSVCVTTFNRVGYLRQAIDAILAQTFPDFELLILDNHSSDGTLEYVAQLTDRRIRYVRNPPNSSIEFNGASAYYLARGKRVIATHDDDVMEPNMLELQMAEMDRNPNLKAVWTNVRLINEDGEALYPEQDLQPEFREFQPGEFITTFLTERIWPLPTGLMVERGYFLPKPVMRFYFNDRNSTQAKEKYPGCNDVLAPAEINIKHAIGYFKNPLLKYRLHTTQDTNNIALLEPPIYLHRKLRGFARRCNQLDTPDWVFDCATAKYEIQLALCQSNSDRDLKRVQKIADRALSSALQGIKNTTYANGHLLLPPLLLSALLGNGKSVTIPSPDKDFIARSKTTYCSIANTSIAYAAWLERSRSGQSIFQTIPIESNIMLMGSVLVAALLVLDAKRSGHRIVGIIDSNPTRQGKKLLGIPIYPPSRLTENSASTNLIVLTSERDQEAALSKKINSLSSERTAHISWKTLATAPGPN